MVVALDFATRRVIESTEEDVRIKEKLHDDIKKHLVNVEKLYRKLQKQSEVQAVPSVSPLLSNYLSEIFKMK
jgi:signal transduction histidine kinase